MKKLQFYIIWAILKSMAILPLCVLYCISDLLYYIIRYIVHYRYAVIKGNLERSFPEKDRREIQRIMDSYYRHLSDSIFETIKLLHISDEEMKKRVTVVNSQLIDAAGKEHKPVFLFIGHLGNWEWVQEVTKRLEVINVYGELYRPLANKTMDRVMSLIRSRYSTLQIPQKRAVRTILDLKRHHDSFLIGFIADQRPTRNSLNHWTVFLNQETPYIVGAEEIGRHVEAVYLYLHIAKPARGHYVMTVKTMNDSLRPEREEAYPYTELYFTMLEANIKESPELWLWSHNRWKHSKRKIINNKE